MKKVLFFAAGAKSKNALHDDEMSDAEDDYSNPKNASVHFQQRAYTDDDDEMDFDDL